MTVYKSKISTRLVVFLAIILGSEIILMACLKIWIGLIVVLTASALIIHTLLTTYYTIDNGILKIRSGLFFNKSVNIKFIRKISETNSVISSPAASFDRLEIWYNRFDSVIVSPMEKKAFVEQLISLNPLIELKRK